MSRKIKKILILTLLCAIFACCSIFLVGCNGGEPVGSIAVGFYAGEKRVSYKIMTENEPKRLPEADCAEGYFADGWYFDNGEWQKEFSMQALGDYIREGVQSVNVYAKITPIEYTITYANTKGADTDDFPSTYNIESNTFDIPEISADYYDFDGWFSKGAKIEKIVTGSIGDITLSAQFTPIEYSITYEGTAGAVNPNPSAYNYESGEITLEEPSRDGYKFEGWYSNEQLVTSIPALSHGELELTAEWSLINYTIKYENTLSADLSGFPEAFTVEDDDITLPEITNVMCHEFVCWLIDGKQSTVIAKGTTHNIVAKASFSEHHEVVKDTGYSATCTNDGLSDGTHCDKCGETLIEQVTLNATGHDYTVSWKWEEFEGATLTLVCKNDNAHTHTLEGDITSERKDPTCSAAGSVTYTATVYFEQKTYTDKNVEIIQPVSHHYVKIDNDKENHTCDMCKQKFPHTDKNYDGTCDVCSLFIEKIIQVANKNQLFEINNDMTAAYLLTQDITLDGSWEGLGAKDKPFTGKFYGNGHSISGLSFSKSTDGALFIANNGLIDGLVLIDISITETDGATFAGIAAYNYGTISNCTIKGTNSINALLERSLEVSVSGNKKQCTFVAGAICGENQGKITGCRVEGTLSSNFTASCYAYHNGMLAGIGTSSTVNSTVYMGAVAGKNAGTIEDTVVDCGQSVSATAKATHAAAADYSYAYLTVYAGSVAGQNSSLLKNCSARACKNITQYSSGNGNGYDSGVTLPQAAMFEGIIGENTGRTEQFSTIE